MNVTACPGSIFSWVSHMKLPGDAVAAIRAASLMNASCTRATST